VYKTPIGLYDSQFNDTIRKNQIG